MNNFAKLTLAVLALALTSGCENPKPGDRILVINTNILGEEGSPAGEYIVVANLEGYFKLQDEKGTVSWRRVNRYRILQRVGH